jgi:hypothetical protein
MLSIEYVTAQERITHRESEEFPDTNQLVTGMSFQQRRGDKTIR